MSKSAFGMSDSIFHTLLFEVSNRVSINELKALNSGRIFSQYEIQKKDETNPLPELDVRL